MTILGQLALWLALLLSAWGAVVGYLGGRRGDPALIQSARRTTYALMGLLTVASLALVVALLKNDFNVTYVASYSSRNLPTAYKLSAFYGGQAGSLLFWALVLTLFAAAGPMGHGAALRLSPAVRRRGDVGGDAVLRVRDVVRCRTRSSGSTSRRWTGGG